MIATPFVARLRAGASLPTFRREANRRWKNCFSPVLYRSRNAIKRMFCHPKDFRRIATRCNHKADNFPAAVCITVTVSY